MNDDIIKLLDLKDEDVEVEGPVISKDMKLLTVTKRLHPMFCPICNARMYSKGIYISVTKNWNRNWVVALNSLPPKNTTC